MDLTAWGVPPRSEDPEWIDLPETPWEEVLRGMRDVQRVNALLLTYPILLHTFARLASFPAQRPLRVLDVATGLADIPRALAGWARARGRKVEIVGLDLNPRILAMAKDTLGLYPEISLVAGDALALPFPEGSFDWALCHLSLHHLPPARHAEFLRGLDRVIRPGGAILLGDLERSRAHQLLAASFLRLIASEIGAHDGELSILRAPSAAELDALVAEAGLGYLRRVWPAPAAQFVLAGIKPAP